MKYFGYLVVIILTMFMLISCGKKQEANKVKFEQDPVLLADFNQFFSSNVSELDAVITRHNISKMVNQPMFQTVTVFPMKEKGRSWGIMAVVLLIGEKPYLGITIPMSASLRFGKINGKWHLLTNDGYVSGKETIDSMPPELHADIKKVFPHTETTDFYVLTAEGREDKTKQN